MSIDLSHETQMRFWGYAVEGDVLEFGATIAEGCDYLRPRAWDRTAADLRGETIDGVRVPDSWALSWLTEMRLREEREASRCR